MELLRKPVGSSFPIFVAAQKKKIFFIYTVTFGAVKFIFQIALVIGCTEIVKNKKLDLSGLPADFIFQSESSVCCGE